MNQPQHPHINCSRHGLAILLTLALLPFFTALAKPDPKSQRVVIIAQGAAGSEEFAPVFAEAVKRWESAAFQGEATPILTDTREALEAAITETIAADPAELWVVLVGHGTFNGRSARFALKGPDVSSDEIAEWLKPWEKDLIFVNTSSASAPFLPALSGENRVVITATKSGHEVFYSRFGSFLAGALMDPSADLNKDEQISILEAFLLAGDQTAEFFEKEARLATEHSIIDDNGDGKGTPAEWFEGIRATRKAKDAEPDGLLARNAHLVPNDLDRSLTPELRKRRNELELQAEALREKRLDLGDEAYYAQLEAIFLEIAKIYQQDS